MPPALLGRSLHGGAKLVMARPSRPRCEIEQGSASTNGSLSRCTRNVSPGSMVREPLIGERPFAIRRRELGLDLHRAAARLGISAKYLRALERGQVPLSLLLAQRMSVAYATTVRELTRPAGAGGTGDRGAGGDGNVARPVRQQAVEGE
jgi:Helix-turn-helix